VELDVCRDMDRNGLELPAFCPAAEELDRHRCVISQLTLSRDDDGGVFTLLSADNSDDEMRFGDLQTEYPGCLETNGDSWYPEQVVLRSLWTRARIRDSRRLVTEWECYRSTGDFGCGGVDDLADRKREDLVLRDYGFRRPGGFNANDDRWRAMTGAQLSSDSDNDLMFNRFSPLAHTDGLLLGCWGDEVLSGFEETTTGSIVGGDCADADALEAEPSLEGVLEAQNRGRYEGPDDLLAVFDGRAVDCDVCTDGIDNNCNGTIDCLEPACARCYVGQSSGGCGADACSVGGCSSSSTGGIQSTGAMSLLMLMLGLGWRRRREDEDEDLAA
jgi:MYXO-CTERM domain-containing protein